MCWKKLYYTVLSIGNCQLYCFQSTLSKVTDIFVDNFDRESHYFPGYQAWSETCFSWCSACFSCDDKCSMFHIFYEIKLYKCFRFSVYIHCCLHLVTENNGRMQHKASFILTCYQHFQLQKHLCNSVSMHQLVSLISKNCAVSTFKESFQIPLESTS